MKGARRVCCQSLFRFVGIPPAAHQAADIYAAAVITVFPAQGIQETEVVAVQILSSQSGDGNAFAPGTPGRCGEQERQAIPPADLQVLAADCVRPSWA